MAAPTLNGPATRKRPGPGHRDWSSMPRQTLEERFWSKVDRGADDECWNWLAGKHHNGYGAFHVVSGQSQVRAHRFAYELLVGPIPNGLQLDHLCRNPACVNPAHLEPVTQRENILRGVGLTARQAAQTHCKRGHPLSGDNVRIEGGHHRVCLACRKRNDHERYIRRQSKLRSAFEEQSRG